MKRIIEGVVMGSFWIDHGDLIFKFATFFTVLLGFGILILRQGIFMGKLISALNAVEKKADNNCKSINKAQENTNALRKHVNMEFNQIEKARYVTHDQHAVLTRDCKGGILSTMEKNKMESDIKIAEINGSIKEMAKSIKEIADNNHEKLDEIKDFVHGIHTEVAALSKPG